MLLWIHIFILILLNNNIYWHLKTSCFRKLLRLLAAPRNTVINCRTIATVFTYFLIKQAVIYRCLLVVRYAKLIRIQRHNKCLELLTAISLGSTCILPDIFWLNRLKGRFEVFKVNIIGSLRILSIKRMIFCLNLKRFIYRNGLLPISLCNLCGLFSRLLAICGFVICNFLHTQVFGHLFVRFF